LDVFCCTAAVKEICSLAVVVIQRASVLLRRLTEHDYQVIQEYLGYMVFSAVVLAGITIQ